jgi:hypothetical protein
VRKERAYSVSIAERERAEEKKKRRKGGWKEGRREGGRNGGSNGGVPIGEARPRAKLSCLAEKKSLQNTQSVCCHFQFLQTATTVDHSNQGE